MSEMFPLPDGIGPKCTEIHFWLDHDTNEFRYLVEENGVPLTDIQSANLQMGVGSIRLSLKRSGKWWSITHEKQP